MISLLSNMMRVVSWSVDLKTILDTLNAISQTAFWIVL